MEEDYNIEDWEIIDAGYLKYADMMEDFREVFPRLHLGSKRCNELRMAFIVGAIKGIEIGRDNPDYLWDLQGFLECQLYPVEKVQIVESVGTARPEIPMAHEPNDFTNFLN